MAWLVLAFYGQQGQGWGKVGRRSAHQSAPTHQLWQEGRNSKRQIGIPLPLANLATETMDPKE